MSGFCFYFCLKCLLMTIHYEKGRVKWRINQQCFFSLFMILPSHNFPTPVIKCLLSVSSDALEQTCVCVCVFVCHRKQHFHLFITIFRDDVEHQQFL